jgi:microcystin-dependent protein
MTRRILFLTAALVAASAAPAAAQPQHYLGEVMLFAGNFCPSGWTPMAGQVMHISQNTALFSILGTAYGGDGTTTFALPKASPIPTANGAALTQCIATAGVWPMHN